MPRTIGISRPLRSVSSDDIRMELHRREKIFAPLTRLRLRIARKLDALDQKLKSLGVSGPSGSSRTRAIRRRPHNKQTLVEALKAGLKGKTLSVTEAAAAVQKAGYRTTSRHFRTQVNIALVKSAAFRRVSRGKYTAK